MERGFTEKLVIPCIQVSPSVKQYADDGWILVKPGGLMERSTDALTTRRIRIGTSVKQYADDCWVLIVSSGVMERRTA